MSFGCRTNPVDNAFGRPASPSDSRVIGRNLPITGFYKPISGRHRRRSVGPTADINRVPISETPIHPDKQGVYRPNSVSSFNVSQPFAHSCALCSRLHGREKRREPAIALLRTRCSHRTSNTTLSTRLTATPSTAGHTPGVSGVYADFNPLFHYPISDMSDLSPTISTPSFLSNTEPRGESAVG